mmetsp:Transcript_16270/g.26549  ORF Transcript_16270/g.26549 Transcript_16270/m.26549 type:complete len:102 (+) Transcript_16270:1951-2256(+)
MRAHPRLAVQECERRLLVAPMWMVNLQLANYVMLINKEDGIDGQDAKGSVVKWTLGIQKEMWTDLMKGLQMVQQRRMANYLDVTFRQYNERIQCLDSSSKE